MTARELIKYLKKSLGIRPGRSTDIKLCDEVDSLADRWLDTSEDDLTPEQLADLEKTRPYFDAIERIRVGMCMDFHEGPDDVADAVLALQRYATELIEDSWRYEANLKRVRHCNCGECWLEATEERMREVVP